MQRRLPLILTVMKKMGKAQNGKKLTVKDAERKADSLSKESNRKSELARKTIIDRKLPTKEAVRKGDSIFSAGMRDFDSSQRLRNAVYRTKKAAGYKNGGNIKKK